MDADELAARLDEETAGLRGEELVQAVRRLAETLGAAEREELGRLLLERARDARPFDYGSVRGAGATYRALLRRLGMRRD